MPDGGTQWSRGDYYRLDGINELIRAMRGTDKDIRNDVRKVNRKWTNVIRDKIRAIAPRTGGTVRNGLSRRRKNAKKKTGPKHDTRTGAFRASVKSKVGADYGRIEGGGGPAPHFIVNEFGGAVWWHRMGRGVTGQLRSRGAHRSATENRNRFGGNIGHIIPVRARSPQASFGGRTMSGGGGSFPRGYYFFPTVDENVEHVFEAYWDEFCQTLDRKLH